MPSVLASTLIIALTTSILVGCAGRERITILSEPVQPVPLNTPQVRELDLSKIEWFVVTPENIEEVFAELQDQRKDIVLFALTDDGYKAMSLNFAQIRELLAQQQAIIKAYKEYYNRTQTAIDSQRDDYNKKLEDTLKSKKTDNSFSLNFLNMFKKE
jgi:hypothetical protein